MTREHRHGWDCFKDSGGMLTAIEEHIPLYERIRRIYETAYRTGYKNGYRDALAGRQHEQPTITAFSEVNNP